MIRKLQEPDIDQVADIWLDTNLKAHDFIPAQYWKDNFESVKKMLLQSEVYVYENETTHNIDGFLGLDADYIAGIFVRSSAQSKGIGKLLLDFAAQCGELAVMDKEPKLEGRHMSIFLSAKSAKTNKQ